MTLIHIVATRCSSELKDGRGASGWLLSIELLGCVLEIWAMRGK